MEPRIQYAKTSDGINIAFSTAGRGKPLVIMPQMPNLSMQMAWALPEFRGGMDTLSEIRTVVTYDGRGFGLSDRHVALLTVDQLILDLKAVIDRLGLEHFDLMAILNMGPAAITFAARNPDRVVRLVLAASYANGAKVAATPALDAFYAMRKVDWNSYVQVIARQVSNDPRAPSMLAESMTAATFDAFIEAVRSHDATIDVANVQAESLVLAPREGPLAAVLGEEARALATGVPRARLALADFKGSFQAVRDFLAEGELERTGYSSTQHEPVEGPSGMTAILFADIADSTALTERLGDAAFRAKARDLDAALRSVIREHAGTPIEGKLLGDGVLAVFTSGRQAIEGALACGRAGDHAGMPLHLGLHAGDVIREENNIYGGAVNVASRISGLSAPGEVLVSETVRSLARTSAGVQFEDRGEQALKGVGEPLRVWAVIARENRQAGGMGS
jgi:class 3 adenylate cyclase/pimeloyl-ACP methyl ester carboxylesterase